MKIKNMLETKNPLRIKIPNVHKSVAPLVQAVNLRKATLKTTNFPATPIMSAIDGAVESAKKRT